MNTKQRYLIYISYIGTGFRGSQIQNSGNVTNIKPTVQGTIEKAISWFLKLEGDRAIPICISSRTDSGVHAVKTAIHVDLPPLKGKFIEPEIIQWGLNGYFIKENLHLRILEVLQVPDIFHARYSALQKIYFYRIAILKSKFCKKNKFCNIPITEIDRTFFLRFQEFDFAKAKELTQLFLGEKDFGAILGRPSKNKVSTVCNINSFFFEEAQPFMPNVDSICQQYDYYHITCSGNRFLNHMLRRMVGVVLSFGANLISLNKVKDLFEKPYPSSWSSKIIVVPGHALYLMNVNFNPEHLVMTEEEKEWKKKQLVEVEQAKININNKTF